MPWKNNTGFYTLLVAATITSIGITANVYGFTTLCDTTTSMPELANTDQQRYFYDALLIKSGGQPQCQAYQLGYCYLITIIWKITGVSIVPLLIINQLAMILTLLLCGHLTHKITKIPSAPVTAIILCASVCYLLNHSTLLLKESLVTFSIILFTTSLLSKRKAAVCIIIISILLLGLIRFHWLPYMVIILLSLSLTKHWIISKRNIYFTVSAFITVWIGFYLLYRNMATDIMTGNDIENQYVSYEPARSAFWEIIGDYFNYPFLKKLIYMPVCAAVQVLTPFPWNFSRDMIYGLSQFYSHISYPWYAVAGIIAYYFSTSFWSKNGNDLLKRISAAGLILWLIPVYLFAGSVSRYALPAIPLLIPCATYIIANKHYKKTSFKIWGMTYSALVATVLITVYFITT